MIYVSTSENKSILRESTLNFSQLFTVESGRKCGIWRCHIPGSSPGTLVNFWLLLKHKLSK